jgi:UDP-N-acetylglucosamine/UDP-N-acetylgalactosamine diphosphorylase
MAADGVEYLSYFQVDNPLVPIADPLFIGLHILEGSQISSRMLPKTCPTEKLGNFCLSGGRLHVIEYSDMPLELAERLNPDGTLAFLSGSPAIHIISRSFVESLTQDGTLKLPWHRADKKVPYLAADGTVVKPESTNAVKLESFIFDALPMAERAIVVEGSRKEMFGPTKNATGVDSAESCRAMLMARDARRLALAGIQVPRDADGVPAALVEISPRCVVDDADAAEYFRANPVTETIQPGQSKAFGK